MRSCRGYFAMCIRVGCWWKRDLCRGRVPMKSDAEVVPSVCEEQLWWWRYIGWTKECLCSHCENEEKKIDLNIRTKKRQSGSRGVIDVYVAVLDHHWTTSMQWAGAFYGLGYYTKDRRIETFPASMLIDVASIDNTGDTLSIQYVDEKLESRRTSYLSASRNRMFGILARSGCTLACT